MYCIVGLTFLDCCIQIEQNLKYGVLQKNDLKIVYVAPMKVLHSDSGENLRIPIYGYCMILFI